MGNTHDVPRTRRILFVIYLFFLSLGAAVFITARIQASHYTVLNHTLRLESVSLVLVTTAVFPFLAIAWIFLSKLYRRRAGSKPAVRSGKTGLVFVPLAFLFLAPLAVRDYLTRDDLIHRLNLLAAVALAGVFFLAALLIRSASAGPPLLAKTLARFKSLSPRKKLVGLFLAAFLVYNLAAFILVSKGVTFSGDEPNYLMTAHSLIHDRDINLANNYADQDYFHFYSKEDNPRLKLGIYGRTGRAEGSVYPINLPGISILMLPQYWLSGFFGGRALTFILKGSLSLWAALLGLQIYLLAIERWRKERLALGLWALYGFTAPVIFYAVHLYPEIPVVFISLLVYRKVASNKPLRTGHLLGLGFLLGTFFWFGVKYNLIFWPLLLVAIYYLFTKHGVRARLAFFIAPAILSLGFFYLFQHWIYGTLSPFYIYEGIMTPEDVRAFKQAVFDLPFFQRIDTFFGYILDQRDGLLLYSPAYAFAFLGLVELFRRARREFFFLLFIALPFLLNYAFFTHRQGYSPQGRVLLSVSWVAAIAIGEFLARNEKKGFQFIFRICAVLSAAAVLILLFHPTFLYQPTTHEFTERPGDLFVWASGLRAFLPPLLPSFIKVDNTGYWPNYVWIAAVLGFILAYAFLKKKESPSPAARLFLVLALSGGVIVLKVLGPQTALYPAVATEPVSGREVGFYTMPMGRDVMVKPGGELYFHGAGRFRILFSSPKKLDKIRIAYGSEKGEYRISARFFDLPLLKDATDLEKKELEVTPPAFYQAGRLYLYEVTASIEHVSGENMKLDPYFISITPLRE